MVVVVVVVVLLLLLLLCGGGGNGKADLCSFFCIVLVRKWMIPRCTTFLWVQFDSSINCIFPSTRWKWMAKGYCRPPDVFMSRTFVFAATFQSA